jgi:hypothetical protein
MIGFWDKFNTMQKINSILIALTLYAATVFAQGDGMPLPDSDSLIFIEKSKLLNECTKESTSFKTIKTAYSFVGTPYVGKTLEINQDEQLVVNLHGLDCSTFIESVLAIMLVSEISAPSFIKYKEMLKKIRYRNGIIEGYESRLHYFTDWIYDNEQKGVVTDITKELGGVPFDREINFMSTHPAAYIQLATDSARIKRIVTIEKEISSRDYYFIPKENVATIETRLEEGMIVAITTGIAGLDIAHVGFLVKVNGRIHLLHASSDAGKVVVSDKPLADYLAGNKRQTGIMVLRVM